MAAVGKCQDAAGDDDTSKVVMRKPRNTYHLSYSDSVDSTDGSCKSDDCGDDDDQQKRKTKKKHVKWSESTDLRERQKIYRRSQMDIPLDYQHLAIEEQREREGVEVWRSHLNSKADDDHDDDNTLVDGEKDAQLCGTAGGDVAASPVAGVSAAVVAGVSAAVVAGVSAAVVAGVSAGYENNSNDDSDDPLDEDLERNLQVIKEETTRFTLYPAYSAAIPVYEEWLSNNDNITGLTDDQRVAMTSQLSLYKRIVDVYRDWTRQLCTDVPKESRFGEITSFLQEASSLGQPPSCVSQVIKEALTDEENVQKQVDSYNNQVQEMIASLDISNKV